jgi:hypothetical protein
MVKVDQQFAAVAAVGAGMGAATGPAATSGLGDVLVEELSTEPGALVGVRDHCLLGQVKAHLVTSLPGPAWF